MIEWLQVDGLYKIPKGLHVGVGLHTILHYMGAIRHHRWLHISPDGQISWLWLRRTGPTGGQIGSLNRRVRFEVGTRQVELYAPRVEVDRMVNFLDRL